MGNDTGGAICQVVAAGHPERLGALVLTNCDAFEAFPPRAFKPLVAAAKVPGGLRAALAPMRSAAVRRSPLGFGLLSHGDVDHLAGRWVEPVFTQRRVLEDLRRFTAAIDPSVTLDVAARLPGFARPVLLAWALDDRLFPLKLAQRLAATLPDARLETIEDPRAFSMLDQPDRLAALIGEFALQRSAAGHAIR